MLYSEDVLEKFIISIQKSISMTEVLLEKDKDNSELKSLLKTLNGSLERYEKQLESFK